MASDKIKDILSPDGARKAEGELSYLARIILRDVGMTNYIWESKLQEYMERNKKRVPKNKKDRSYYRGNLNTQFTNPKMTWRVFLEFLRFLNPIKIKITVSMTWGGSHKTTVHSVNIHTRNEGRAKSIAEEEIALPIREGERLEHQIPSDDNTVITADETTSPPVNEDEDLLF